MAKYQTKINKRAEKALRNIPVKDVQVIRKKVRALADDPRPNGCKKLIGEDNLYRICAGNYRILYTIEDDILVIVVISIGNRKDIYR